MSQAATMDDSTPGDGPICLAITFFLLGIGYALPVVMWPTIDPSLEVKSTGTMNLYTLTAWGGLAHFFYAWRGQNLSLSAFSASNGSRAWVGRSLFLGILALILGVTALGRWFIPVRIFDGVVWVYFIPHFLKAEGIFQKRAAPLRRDNTLLLMSFAYFSIVILAHEFWAEHQVLAFSLGVAMILAIGYWGGLAALRSKDRMPVTLMSAFLVGETLVWSEYAPYMSPTFADGVYGFHVAGASFYHYTRAYAFGIARQSTGSTKLIDLWLSIPRILIVQMMVISIGVLIGYAWPVKPLSLASPEMLALLLSAIWAPQFFTVWVGWHLLSSDVFPYYRRWLVRLS
ncbi:hypothetical protein Spb1_32130 [Planctopirus ephydatiae]|uniref:Uncharacterized protein n=1 Tax=Planctopirus ephydatiae TaxID=2528019 RepID=A0A518GRR5_9PLAN|nr:hypothetical protein [Planctopirus ephydatiae]QDV31269.1 hypothetical protein Spb1_32130 [Planctopirus ephydatiae]